jgi:hypothetical protein
MAYVPATSIEYLRIPVVDGSGSIPGQIAVVASGEPTEDDWKTAAWDNGSYKLLIGPGTDLPLTAGVYTAWVRLDAPPEKVVRRSGPIRVGTCP